jgi:hypothetical protein
MDCTAGFVVDITDTFTLTCWFGPLGEEADAIGKPEGL